MRISETLHKKLRKIRKTANLGKDFFDKFLIFYIYLRAKISKNIIFLAKMLPVPRRIIINFNNKDVSLFVASDITFAGVLFDVFIREDYKIDVPYCPKVIFDIGANFGISPLYFACKYPHAKIYAFEPSPKNLYYLKLNTISLANVGIYGKAVFSTSGKLKLYCQKEHGAQDSLFPVYKDYIEVEGISLDDFIADNSISCIDLLKIDVEGAEMEILRNCKFLEKINYIVGEIHHSFYDVNEIIGLLNKYFKLTMNCISAKEIIFRGINKRLLNTERQNENNP